MYLKFLILIFIPLLLIAAPDALYQRGVNLSNWFQGSDAQQIHFTYYTRQDLVNIQSLGCDHVRLPINMHAMSGASPEYTVDPLLFYFVDQVVDWAEELNLQLILDNHSFDASIPTSPAIESQLKAVWQQYAEHYKNRSGLIYYEVLNEPHDIEDSTWNRIQQTAVDAIREIDTIHTIIIGPADFNSLYNLSLMPQYSDDNLIYTFHFYDPFLFTHQGATWVSPPVDIAGVPFPYDAATMPEKPDSFLGTWLSDLYDSYPTDGTVEHVQSLIDIAAAFAIERGVLLWCGEFGAYQPNSDTPNRARWISTVRKYLEDKQIVWTMWEYSSGFGLFEPGSQELFDYDVDLPIVEALGLTLPEQSEYVLLPDTAGFTLYQDYYAEGTDNESWASSGTLQLYNADDPAQGMFSLYWADVPQYSHITFKFAPIKDLSWLADNNYLLDFRVRSSASGAQLDVRFVDTKTEHSGDHPWRMRHILDATVCNWDGTWQHIVLPLNSFTEGGSWDDNQWYNAQGDFDWAATDLFQIVAEHHDLTGMVFYFDDLKIISPEQAGLDTECPAPGDFSLMQNYPNPFNPATTIRYRLAVDGIARLKLFDCIGREVAVLADGRHSAGEHKLNINAALLSESANQPLSSGVYFYQLTMNGQTQTRKMLLMR